MKTDKIRKHNTCRLQETPTISVKLLALLPLAKIYQHNEHVSIFVSNKTVIETISLVLGKKLAQFDGTETSLKETQFEVN